MLSHVCGARRQAQWPRGAELACAPPQSCWSRATFLSAYADMLPSDVTIHSLLVVTLRGALFPRPMQTTTERAGAKLACQPQAGAPLEASQAALASLWPALYRPHWPVGAIPAHRHDDMRARAVAGGGVKLVV